MRVSDLLSKEIDPEKINSPLIRNEVTVFHDLAKIGLGLEIRPEWQEEYRRNKVTRRKPIVQRILLLDIPDANAYAFLTGGPTIAITIAVPLITRALFIAVLSDGYILNNLRDVHYLRTAYKPIIGCDWVMLVDLLSAFSFEKFDAWARSAPRLPQTPDFSGRGDLAVILSMQAWSFIVFHELGHHAMQHLEAPASRPSGLIYSEIEQLVPASFPSTKPLDGAIFQSSTIAPLSETLLLRHANELEADRYAVAKMYGQFFRSHEAIITKSANYMAMTTMSERSRTRLWLVTIGIVFLLFEVGGRTRGGNSHPRPLFRLQHLFEFTRTQAGAVALGNSMKEFNKGFADALQDLTVIAQNLGVVDPYAVQSDDAAYKDRMMEIRTSRPRIFKDDASE